MVTRSGGGVWCGRSHAAQFQLAKEPSAGVGKIASGKGEALSGDQTCAELGETKTAAGASATLHVVCHASDPLEGVAVEVRDSF